MSAREYLRQYLGRGTTQVGITTNSFQQVDGVTHVLPLFCEGLEIIGTTGEVSTDPSIPTVFSLVRKLERRSMLLDERLHGHQRLAHDAAADVVGTGKQAFLLVDRHRLEMATQSGVILHPEQFQERRYRDVLEG